VKRRQFITLLGGAAAAWPLAARAQQAAMPVVGFLSGGSLTDVGDRVTAFHQGLKEAGFVEGQNVAIEYRSTEHQTDRLRLQVADLLHRQVALIVGSDTPAALAAKAVTTTVPIVFVTGGDPVRVGLVASLNLPGGNVTGVSFTSIELAAKQLGLLRELRPGAARSFTSIELAAKQLGLLRELRPGAARVAVLVDPKFPTTERFVSEVRAAASAVGQQLIVLEVSSDHDRDCLYNARPTWGWRAVLGHWRVHAVPTGTSCRASGST